MQLTKLVGSDDILEYFIKDSSVIEKRILSAQSGLTATDHALYEAIGTISNNDKFNWRKLVKFLESVKVVSYENVYGKRKPILTEDKVLQLRKNLEEKKNGRNKERKNIRY